MEITFILTNGFAFEFTGETAQRAVTVELTADQVKQIEPKQVGTKYGNAQFESLTKVYINSEEPLF